MIHLIKGKGTMWHEKSYPELNQHYRLSFVGLDGSMDLDYDPDDYTE